MTTLTRTSTTAEAATRSPSPRAPVDWRRMRGPAAVIAFALALLGAIGAALGSVVAGRITAAPSTGLVWLLAGCVIGAAVVDTLGHTVWAAAVDRAEGRLRSDLLAAAFEQPLAELGEQAVGEVLDRIDDDTWEVGQLLRRPVWMAVGTVLSAGPLWVVATITWTPSLVLFPVTVAAAYLSIRRLLPEVAARKVVEEAAWTDHAASTEEGIAARDDLRTSLGQAHVLRRNAEIASGVDRALQRVLAAEVRITLRSGGLVHALLAGLAVIGVVLVIQGGLSTAALVTLFLATSIFVGLANRLAMHLPDLQEGMGAVLRLRAMLAVPAEAAGGSDLSAGELDIWFRGLHFGYPHGSFELRDIDLVVPAGHTCALVGRSGSGKSTLASLLSRAVEPEPGSLFLSGVDVTELDLHRLRRGVGVVTQRTEILAGSVAENITLFADVPRERVQAAVVELGLADWVDGLPEGLDTLLGPGGTALSAGEEQLVAFARLLVREVRVVVLDEATARMDPVTEARVVRASERLLRGRTGLLVAHRLSTTERAERVAVLEGGRIVQQGARDELAAQEGPFRRLLEAALEEHQVHDPHHEADSIGSRRRSTAPPTPEPVAPAPSLARATLSVLRAHPRWGLAGGLLFFAASLTGSFGALTGWLWGAVVSQLQHQDRPIWLLLLLVISVVANPVLLAAAFRIYARWWVAARLRVRAAVLAGQTAQHRLRRTPPGEVVARAMDADRLVRYADRWVDFITGLAVATVTAIIAGSWLAGGVLVAVMTAAALASSLGRRAAGRSAAAAATARARFGQALVSAVESVRTVKLAGAAPEVHAHIAQVDAGRVQAAVAEHRVQTLLDGVPLVMVQAGVVAAWWAYVEGHWGLATALLVANAVSGFDWFGQVSGAVITEAPGTKSWMVATSELAGGGDLMRLPSGLDLVAGVAAPPSAAAEEPLRVLSLRGFSAIHDDGTIGVSGIDLDIARGELVLLLGQVGSGKSSLLAGLAGLVHTTGDICWNDRPVSDRQSELRPGRVSYVAQVPRVLSGTFADNVRLDHSARGVDRPIALAQLAPDVAEAGGPNALVGHRGVRLSGGQVQRLALARALACEAELLVADDVSSALDATTEIEVWRALRRAGVTVLGASNKAAALAAADRVVVLVDGEVAAAGPWSELAPQWGRFAG